MIRRRREGRSDHALGHDARRPFQPRGRIRQMFLAIGAVKFLHVLGVRVHDQQMSGHGTFLWGWMLSNERHIGSAAAPMRYGILTVSELDLGCWAATRRSRLSGSIFVDEVHGMDSRGFRAIRSVRDTN